MKEYAVYDRDDESDPLQTSPRRSPCCGADEVNRSEYLGGHGYVTRVHCILCGQVRWPRDMFDC